MLLPIRDSDTKLENVSQYATFLGYCSYKVLKNKGGEGVVREMIDYLIKKEKLQAKLYEIFL